MILWVMVATQRRFTLQVLRQKPREVTRLSHPADTLTRLLGCSWPRGTWLSTCAQAAPHT